MIANEQTGLSLVQAVDPWFWAYTNQIQLTAGPFELEGREFQADVLRTDPYIPIRAVRKATQMTWTETAVLTSLHGMIHGMYPKGVLYLFPTKDVVTEFSKTRFAPLIEGNPCIRQYVKETDMANLKRIGKGFIYFRSGRLSQKIEGEVKTTIQLQSIPVDHSVFDEFDHMDMAAESFADGRMADSNIKTKFFLGNPTIPDYGIDLKFQHSDQRYWMIKCEHCGKYTCLEDTFPECLVERNGDVYRACQHCQREIYPRNGQWVAKRPSLSNEAVGWSISHLNAAKVKPKTILRQYLDPQIDIGNFTRLVLGQPYIEAENRVSVEEVLALCTDKGMPGSDPGPCFMGVDQHDEEKRGQFVVIGKKHSRAYGEIIHINQYMRWADLDPLIKRFKVVRCVVDALPDIEEARAFAKRHPGIVYLHYYNERQKTDYRWDEKQMIVQTNRTESLDTSQSEILDEAIFFPRSSDIMRTFAEQCHNVAKKLEEDEGTKSKRYVYVKLGPDHYRHAYNYECIARRNSPQLLFPELQ